MKRSRVKVVRFVLSVEFVLFKQLLSRLFYLFWGIIGLQAQFVGRSFVSRICRKFAREKLMNLFFLLSDNWPVVILLHLV